MLFRSGQEAVIEIARHAKQEGLPIRFVIIGDEKLGLKGYKDRLMRLVKRYGLEDQVLFTSWLNDMPAAYRSLDLLIHPVQKPEPFGLVIAEAMACARPVAAFDYGGAAEIIGSSEHGFLVERGDVAALWQTIKWAYHNPPETAAIGGRARARVLSAFSLGRASDQMVEVYNSLS